MTDTLDDIRFLADSEHRAVALSALADGTCSRAELRDVTGASSATVGRLLQAFEDRGWLHRARGHATLTTLGEFVAERFAAFHHEMTAVRDLEPLLPYVPLEVIGVDVAALTDAFVTLATPENPFAVVSRVRELERDALAARTLTDFFPEPCIDGRYQSVVHGEQSFEAVFAPVVVDRAMASVAAEKFVAIVAADRADVRVYDDAIEYPAMLHDGVACLVVRDDRNVSIGLIETDHPSIVAWVTAMLDRHHAAATPVAPEELDPSADVVVEAR